ncbi:MAG TPA: alpha-glucosidase [Candidatus Ventricola intestinavium]|nr:alpha-glucosidase [Candidatus Ventricola intestinavium]
MSDWFKQAVVYQVYPKSFMDTNGDGIGDLRGVTQKLDYIKLLGADVIWLNPVYQNSGVDGGYDISDYRAIAPEFGTMEDFDELLAQAHARGIRIVMDLVVNHTSTAHAWFRESRSSLHNEKRDFYIWRPPFKGGVPNGMRSCFSGSAWEKDEVTGEYYLHMFAREQADLNWHNPQVRQAVYDMMRWWLDKGIDGFRMDVIDQIAKPPEILESDGGPGGDGASGPRIHEYLREMNREVLSHYDVMTVGEMGSAKVESALRYASLDGSELSMVFQFEHMDADAGPHHKWTTEPLYLPRLKRVFEKWQVGLHGRAWNSLYWCNHDQPRIVSRFGSDADERSRVLSAKMLGACLHMMQGTPYIYQGEELGMTNYPFRDISESQDVEAIGAYRELVEEKHEMTGEQMMACIRRKGRDNARTPMQWTAGKNAGFTTGTPWMNVNPNHETLHAQAQVSEPDSVFAFYQALIALRKSLSVVIEGDFTLLMPEDEQVFAYTRCDGHDTLLVQCNFSGKEARLDESARMGGRILLGNYDCEGPADRLRPWEARIWIR